MTTQFTSQTNQVFEIKSQSALISCLFDSPEVSKGGKASMSVLTQNVGDDSQIELELYNESAKKVGSIKGKVRDQRCTLMMPIDQPVGSKLKGFVKMSAHKLEQATSTILVVPALQVASIEWLNSQGEALAEISDEAIIEVVIKVAEMPDGTTCQVSLQFQEQSGKKSIVISKKIRASEGKLSLVWIPAFPRPEHNHVHDDDVKPTGGKYEHPKVVAIITYKGSSHESKPIPYSSWMRYEFKGTKGKVTFRLPTGKEVTETIGEDGCIKLKGCGVGAIDTVEIVPSGDATVEEDEVESEATNNATNDHVMEKRKVLIARGWIDMTEWMVNSELDKMVERREIADHERKARFESIKQHMEDQIHSMNKRYSRNWKENSRKIAPMLQKQGFNVELVDYLTKEKFENVVYSKEYVGLYLFMHGYKQSDHVITAGITLVKADLGNDNSDVGELGPLVSLEELDVSKIEQKELAYIQACYNRDSWMNILGKKEVSIGMEVGEEGSAYRSVTDAFQSFYDDMLLIR